MNSVTGICISAGFFQGGKSGHSRRKNGHSRRKSGHSYKITTTFTANYGKTLNNIILLWEKCGTTEIFGRSIVETVTGLKSSRASELLKLLVESEIIEPVKGYGKGKYKFL